MRLVTVLSLAFVLGPSLHSQIVPPVVLKKAQPQYSEAGREARLNGTVLLGVVISPEGQATSFQILRPIGFGLDEKAIEAVTQWRFQPGTKDGHPVPVTAKIEVSFQFSAVGWSARKISFGAADDIQIPSLVSATFPTEAKALDALVTLDCLIDETGHPANIKVKNPSGEKYDEELVTALKHWLFHPATRNGQPVPIASSFEFVNRPK